MCFKGFKIRSLIPKLFQLMNCQCGFMLRDSNKMSSSPKKSMHLSLFAVSFFTIKASGHRFNLRKLTWPTCHLHLYSNFRGLLHGYSPNFGSRANGNRITMYFPTFCNQSALYMSHDFYEFVNDST